MRVSEIMSSRVVSIGMDDTLEKARQQFESFGFHHLMVMEESKLVGVISDRDVLRHLSPYVGTLSERTLDAASLKKRAHQVMSRSVVTARPDTDVAEAARLMLTKNVSCLPVLDRRGLLIGLVTARDVLAWTVSQFCGAGADSPCRTPDRHAA